MKVKISNITWDLTEEDLEVNGLGGSDYENSVKELNLPTELVLDFDDFSLADNSDDDDTEDLIGDTLTDMYGFCFNGYEWEIIPDDEERI